MQNIDNRDIIEANEIRTLAMVVRRALGILIIYWRDVQRLPVNHPYRQAASMLSGYLERRYGV